MKRAELKVGHGRDERRAVEFEALGRPLKGAIESKLPGAETPRAGIRHKSCADMSKGWITSAFGLRELRLRGLHRE